MKEENEFFEKRRMSLKQRERVAISAMNAILMNPSIIIGARVVSEVDVAQAAIRMVHAMDNEWHRL